MGLLLRIKQVSQLENKNTRDYFANRKRRFQAVVKGCFRTPLSMSRCVTGQLFDRSAGPLPARWIVKSIIKFISILAPRKLFLLNEKRKISMFLLCIFDLITIIIYTIIIYTN